MIPIEKQSFRPSGTAVAEKTPTRARLAPRDVVALTHANARVDASAEETYDALDVVVRGCFCVVAQISPVDAV